MLNGRIAAAQHAPQRSRFETMNRSFSFARVGERRADRKQSCARSVRRELLDGVPAAFVQ